MAAKQSQLRFQEGAALRQWLLPLVLAATVSVGPAGGHAASPATPDPDMTPIEKVTNLRAQPLALLAKFPEAGVAMASFVAHAIVGEPPIVDPILSVSTDATPEQASAIGAGMVRAVRAIQAKQPQLARAIVDKVMKSNNRWLKTTFRAIGPNYSVAKTFNAPPVVQPRILNRLPVGEELTREGRLNDRETTVNRQQEKRGTEELEQWHDSDDIFGDGTIVAVSMVAVLASDAPSNGVASTSPTN